MSRFTAAKDPSLWQRHATRFAAAVQLRCGGPESMPQEYFSSQRRSGGPESMGTVFLPSTFKIHHVINNN